MPIAKPLLKTPSSVHKNTVKTLFLAKNVKSCPSKLKMFIPTTARRLLENKPSGYLNRMVPKRGFNSKIDNMIERGLANLPQGNIAYLIVALNTLFYGAYCFWPKYSMHSYLNNFTFSLYGLNKGYVWNMMTCHFAHQSFPSWLIDSIIIFLLC